MKGSLVKGRNALQSLTSSLIKKRVIDQEKEKKPWTSVRLTGRLFEMNRSKSIDDLSEKLDFQMEKMTESYPSCTNQFKHYCRLTSMHCFHYITERKRSFIERIFWICWCIFGIGAAIYLMGKVFHRWNSNPVITSVQSTNYPVTNLYFPSVTICTVNKAINEKMVIQGCRFNYTFSQMNYIIGELVDPDGKNNDINDEQKGQIKVKPEMAVKLLRLVTPKCEDYLLYCQWNRIKAPCSYLFKLVLTDTGYCCSFNSIQTKHNTEGRTSDAEVIEQEREYDYLQKAVWNYHDLYREKFTHPEEGAMNSTLDSEACPRVYDDSMFPKICYHINKCRRNPKSCNLTMDAPSPSASSLNGYETLLSSSPTTMSAAEKLKFIEFPLKASGAGRSRGLTLMLDTLRCGIVPTDSFKGLRVFIHQPDEFPSVSEKGFIVGPGMETQVGVSATDTFSVDVLRAFSPSRRGCYFSDEFTLKHYNDYSRSSCVVECENEFIYQECQCVPYYSSGNYSICSVDKIKSCVKNAIDLIQKKNIPNRTNNTKEEGSPFKFKSRTEIDEDKTCTDFCLPACNETFYHAMVTAAIFPNQVIPNKTKILRELINEQHHFLDDIKYVSASISVLRVFFRDSSIMQYKRDELFTWENFVSNIGGVMGLCLGFSLLSLVEVIYFFTMRFLMDIRRFRRTKSTVENIITKKSFNF